MTDSKSNEETMTESKRNEETFLAKLCKGWRVTVYEQVRERLGLKEGDLLRVTIRKEKAGV